MSITTFALGELLEEFAEEGQLSTGVPYIDKRARLFKEGRHKGKDWSAADLAKMEATFSAPTGEFDWSVPLQIDHSDSARDTAGHLRQVSVDGQRLLGVVRTTGQANVDGVKAGNLRKLSIGVRRDGSIHHVAFTPHPAVGDAELFSEDPESEDTPVADTDTKPTPPAPPAPAAGTFKSVEQLEAEFAEKTKAFEARQAAMEARLAAQDEVIRFAELAACVDRFSEAGKTSPAMRSAELDLLKTFSDDQLKLYTTLKDQQPAVVDFSVRGSAHQTPPGGSDEKTAADEAEAMRKLSKRNGGQ